MIGKLHCNTKQVRKGQWWKQVYLYWKCYCFSMTQQIKSCFNHVSNLKELTSINIEWQFFWGLVWGITHFYRSKNIYCVCVPLLLWLVYFLPHFWGAFPCFFPENYVCMASIQERFLTKSGLWWRAYCIWIILCKPTVYTLGL